MSSLTETGNDLKDRFIVPKPPPVPPNQQPSATAPELKLEPATPLEYAQCACLNAEEWKGPLSLSRYMEREQGLQLTDLTKNGRITGWILTSDALPTNPDGSRPILACCESIAFHAYVSRIGKIWTVRAHGVASVFTRPEHRGRGYASRMMEEMGKRLDTWQPLDDTDIPDRFSVLFSDIGPNFYARHGWKVFPSTHIELPLVDDETYESVRKTLPEVDELTTRMLNNLDFKTWISWDLRHLSKVKRDTTFIAIHPEDHFGWHFARDEFHALVLGRDFPDIKGALHDNTGIVMIWCHVYAAEEKDWQLHVLHVLIPSLIDDRGCIMQAMSALLLRAQWEAHRWGMKAGVQIWDPPDLVVAAAQAMGTNEQGSVHIVTRDKDHLCSLRWVGKPNEKVVWMHREKYAWC